MKKEDVLKYVDAQGDKSFVIRTEEEEATFLQNHAKKVEEEQIGPNIAKVHNQYDEDMFSITGLRRGGQEKTYDFLKRIYTSYKTDAEKGKSLETEMASLKKQIADGNGSEALAKELKSVQDAYKALQNEKETEITKLKTEHETYRAKSEIMSGLPGITIKKGMPEDATQTFINSVVEKLVSMSQWQDGKLVFMENGVVKRNPHNALAPFTAPEMLKEMLKSITDTSRKPDGKGPGLNDAVSFEKDKNGKITKVSLLLPDSVKTKEELSKHLVSIGLLRGTQEYLSAYSEYSPSLPTR